MIHSDSISQASLIFESTFTMPDAGAIIHVFGCRVHTPPEYEQQAPEKLPSRERKPVFEPSLFRIFQRLCCTSGVYYHVALFYHSGMR